MGDSSDRNGLSAAEAARRLSTDGPNILPTAQHRLFDILLKAISEPMFLLLIVAAVLYLLLGDLHEGLLLLFMVCITIGLTLYQEGKTERALEALRDMSSPRALVQRDGQAVRVPGRDVVVGDLLIVSEGDRIAADALLVEARNLQVDESLLTGEAWPVSKRVNTANNINARPGGEDLPFMWSGTLVVRGSGIARVTATGAHSEIGKIGHALQSVSKERSPLQIEIARTVKLLAIGGLALSVIATAIYGMRHGDWLQAILVGIALAMSLLPEEYPVILAVFPAIGAWRMSRVQVLTRRLAAIETLGSISVLCTDKTGTLTENRMAVVQMYAKGVRFNLAATNHAVIDSAFKELAAIASLASAPNVFDPMEKAIRSLAERHGMDLAVSGMLKEYPVSPSLRAMSQVWQSTDDGACIVAAKGAPEAIAALCRLDESNIQSMKAVVDDMAGQGLRVLAIARAESGGSALPSSQEDFAFRYLGLIALADPLRKEIPEAVQQCKEAGIRIVMITGDYPRTAESIAQQAGMPTTGVLSGEEVDKFDDTRLALRLRESDICARITPDQKLRIIQALKANGEIVAMTGDGVNDAPALKAAHVGIAMGGRGTDVAREASSLVLLDDNFASIVRGIRLGRRIFANMRSAMSYVLSIHVPIAGMALLPALFGWPILLYPMHIAFLELIIDPACSLAFENEASDIEAMQRPPRRPNAPLIGGHELAQSMAQGTIALILVALFYGWSVDRMPDANARAATFAVLVVANLALIFSNLSRSSALNALHSPNRIPWAVAATAIAVLLMTFYIPELAAAFHFAPLAASDISAALAFGIVSIVGYELVKYGLRGWRTA